MFDSSPILFYLSLASIVFMWILMETLSYRAKKNSDTGLAILLKILSYFFLVSLLILVFTQLILWGLSGGYGGQGM